ncbi:hypothetical protein ABVF54_12620 [Enterococcus mundtii]|uniref:hypothetical protein n=1 Tax=Enterococcus mundtii TaxID=53346 RepID=UPI00129C260F|nr:hypothetical protein [Enterococcus mundtii]MRI74086.1 hypothetical protein [Enterococcus mundtii]
MSVSSYYKVGWWKNGERYRYCLGMGYDGMIYYRTKRQVLENSRIITARHPDYDKWFSKAEYVGLKLDE